MSLLDLRSLEEAGAPQLALPSPGSLVLTGAIPAVLTPRQSLPTAGTLVLTGATPLVRTPRVSLPLAGSLVLTGATPAVATPRRSLPTAGALVLTGAVPVVSVGGNATALPSAGHLVLTGATPDVSVSGAGGHHAVGPRRRVGTMALGWVAPPQRILEPVMCEPVAARLYLIGAVPLITINDDDLVLTLAA